MNIRSQTVQKLLTLFSGHAINQEEVSSYHKFSLRLFTNPKRIANPRIEFTLQMDITEINKNYENHYKNKVTPPASFTAFFKWLLLKAMYATPFNWRCINNQWYHFNNLPLFIAIRASGQREEGNAFLYNVVDSSWEDFCKKHSLISPNPDSAEEQTELEALLFLICYQIERLHLPHMTNYRTTIRPLDIDSHRPSIIFSDPYLSENKLYLPIHFSISHASLMPELAEDFIKKLTMFANKTPEEVEAEYKSYSLQNNQVSFLKHAKL